MMERPAIRNYAAQAERALYQGAAAMAARRDVRYAADFAATQHVARQISNAVHFALPDGGVIMDDDLRGIRGEFDRHRTIHSESATAGRWSASGYHLAKSHGIAASDAPSPGNRHPESGGAG